MTECDFLIIGGGMGGASCAYWLSREHRVIVLEMEDQPGYHSTGRSAAVYTEAYGPRAVRALAKSSGDFFRHPPQGFAPGPLAEQHGLVCIAREDQKPALYEALAAVQDLSPEIHEIDVGEAIERVPVLRRGYLAAAFLDPSTLFLDVNAIHHGYLRGLRANGGDIVTRAEATRIKRKADRWRVTTPAGEFVAPVIINAAGAWADVVAERAGARSIALQPKRRTVIAFAPPGNVDHRDWPLTFDTDEQFYFKLDAGTVLASPADETPVPPQDAQPDELDIAITVDRIERATIMKVARIIRSWAGLRSFVRDDVPVVGYAPDTAGFFWCAGQGGYGILTSNGMGRCSAALAAGDALPADVQALGVNAVDLAPQRLWDT